VADNATGRRTDRCTHKASGKYITRGSAYTGTEGSILLARRHIGATAQADEHHGKHSTGRESFDRIHIGIHDSVLLNLSTVKYEPADYAAAHGWSVRQHT
jgi:hypothetical protein